MAQAAIAAEIHQTLDVDTDLAAQVAFDEIVAVDHFADLQHFLVGELADAAIQRDLHLLHDLASALLADAMDILKRDHHALVGRDIDAGNTGHGLLSCHRPLGRTFRLKRFRASSLVEHDLFRKPVPASRDHALLARAGVHKRKHDALTPWFPGARHRLITIRSGCGAY